MLECKENIGQMGCLFIKQLINKQIAKIIGNKRIVLLTPITQKNIQS